MEQEKSKGIFVQKTEEEVIFDLKKSPDAYRRFLVLDEMWQELFMAFCTGKKTLPVLYDTVFKKLMDPEAHRERLEDCVSSLLGRKVKIRRPAIPHICCFASTTASRARKAKTSATGIYRRSTQSFCMKKVRQNSKPATRYSYITPPQSVTADWSCISYRNSTS